MALGPLEDIPVPLVGVGGRASCAVPVWWAAGAGRGPGLTVIVVDGSQVPGSVWPAGWWFVGVGSQVALRWGC